MPKKKTSGTKKTAKKPSTKRTRSSAKTSSGIKKNITFNMVPIYVLSIMVLLAAVIIMVNNFRKSGTITKNNISSSADKNDIVKNRDEEKEKNNSIDTDPDTERDKNTRTEISKHEETGQKEFQIYLVKFNRQTEKMSLAPVKRMISSASPLTGALNELIKGPSKSEEKQGLLTAIPDELKIRSVQVIGKSAVLDFNDAIEENANGEILLTRIDQLVYTVTQFDGIENIVIKVNGKQKNFLGGEGLSVSGPIGKRGNR